MKPNMLACLSCNTSTTKYELLAASRQSERDQAIGLDLTYLTGRYPEANIESPWSSGCFAHVTAYSNEV